MTALIEKSYRQLLMVICISFMTVNADAQKKKFYFPAWTYHKKNAAIAGISGGLFAGMDSPRQTNTFGLRIEAPGTGLLAAFVPSSPVSETDSAFQEFKTQLVSEKIYGASISLMGTTCNCTVNGFTVGGITQILGRVNGVSFSPISFSEVHNGIQMGIFNQSYKVNGLQIGFMNKSSRTRGIQIGLWNRNEKRSLPLINWNFSN